MSRAYKCDRCNILFQNYDRDFNYVLIKYFFDEDRCQEYDLCPQCQQELERWFNNVQSKTD